MGTVVRPFTEDLEGAVKAFNLRLRQLGGKLVFPECHLPNWLPKIDGRDTFQEYFLAVDDGMVRGAYILKYQPFLVAGQNVRMAEYRLPLSEGQFDKQFAAVGVQLYLDAIRKQPELFSIGIGGYEEPAAQMMMSVGWKTWLVPFYFRVLNARRFLRNIVYLRTTPLRRWGADMLAFSGLGTPLIHAYQSYKTRGHRADSSPVDFHEENKFGDWANQIWQAAQDEYSLIAARDAQALNLLYPASDPRWIRLRVMHEGQAVGWAVVLNVPMEGHNYFGNMRVGSLIDCLALPGMEPKVANAVRRYLTRHEADIVVTNLSHRRWRSAIEGAGFWEGPSNFIFAASKKISALLDPFEENKHRVHMTRGDGGGPQNLLAARK